MLILASESDPVLFVATRDPAGVATFWRPATRATQRPCQPWAKVADTTAAAETGGEIGRCCSRNNGDGGIRPFAVFLVYETRQSHCSPGPARLHAAAVGERRRARRSGQGASGRPGRRLGPRTRRGVQVAPRREDLRNLPEALRPAPSPSRRLNARRR